jgi:hypothetical protein
MSKKTAAVDILLLKCRVTWSQALGTEVSSCDVYESPNRLPHSVFRSSMCLWTVCRIAFSNGPNLPVVDRRIIGPRFRGNFWSLSGLGKVISFASFQGCGKWDSRKQWLNNCVIRSNGRLGRCLKHSFRMPKKPLS